MSEAEQAVERLRVMIGYQLRMARIRAGYSIEHLAELCGESARTIRKLERGDLPNASLVLIADVAHAMGLQWRCEISPRNAPDREEAAPTPTEEQQS